MNKAALNPALVPADNAPETDFYIPATGPAARARRTLKHDDTFAVFDSHGDIGASAGGPDGIFHADTRFLSRFEPRSAPPVRVVAELDMRRTDRENGVQFDAGQNLTGWVRLVVRGAAGDVVTIRHAEILEPSGALHTAALRTPAPSSNAQHRWRLRSVKVYLSKRFLAAPSNSPPNLSENKINSPLVKVLRNGYLTRFQKSFTLSCR